MAFIVPTINGDAGEAAIGTIAEVSDADAPQRNAARADVISQRQVVIVLGACDSPPAAPDFAYLAVGAREFTLSAP